MEDPIMEFRLWYFSKPIVTRTYITVSFLLALLATLNIVSPYALYYTFEDAFINLQPWRVVTTVFFHGKLSFSFIFSMYFVHFALNNLETMLFTRRNFPDFIWLLTIVYASTIVLASFFNLYFTSDAFIFALMYIWCKRRPFEEIRLSMMFIPSGIRLKSGYFPWFFMGFNVLLGESFVVYIVGLLLGHGYIFIKDILKPKTGRDYLPTPKVIRKMFTVQENN